MIRSQSVEPVCNCSNFFRDNCEYLKIELDARRQAPNQDARTKYTRTALGKTRHPPLPPYTCQRKPAKERESTIHDFFSSGVCSTDLAVFLHLLLPVHVGGRAEHAWVVEGRPSYLNRSKCVAGQWRYGYGYDYGYG